MVKDYHVERYKEEFIGLYDRNSEEFRKDLDRLISMAFVAGASREKYRILDIVRTKSIRFVVEATLDNYTKVLSPKVAAMLERELSAVNGPKEGE